MLYTAKTLEKNVRNKIGTKLIKNEEDYLKFVSKPSYKSQKIFDNNLVAITKKQGLIKV